MDTTQVTDKPKKDGSDAVAFILANVIGWGIVIFVFWAVLAHNGNIR